MNEKRELDDLRRRLAAVGVRGLPLDILERDRADEIRKMVEVVGPLLGHYKSDVAFREVLTGWFQDLNLPSAVDAAMVTLLDRDVPVSRRELIANTLRTGRIEPRHFSIVKHALGEPDIGPRLTYNLVELLGRFSRTEHEDEAAALVLAAIKRTPALLDGGTAVLRDLHAYETRHELRRLLASAAAHMHPEAQRSVERRLESMERKAAKAKAKPTTKSRRKASKSGDAAPRSKPKAAKPRATKKPAARETTTPKKRSPR